MPVTVDCPVCGFGLQFRSANAKPCPRCKTLVGPNVPNYSTPKSSGSSAVAWIIIGLVVGGVALVASMLFSDPNRPTPPARFEPKVGDRVALGHSGIKGPHVFVARNSFDFDAMLDAQNAATKDLLAVLITQGRVLMIEVGTQVVIEKRPAGSAYFHIVSGPYAGQSGWIQVEMLGPVGP